jgi:hypothetical protein
VTVTSSPRRWRWPRLLPALWGSAFVHGAVFLLAGRFGVGRPPPGAAVRDGVVELAWVEGEGGALPKQRVDDAPVGGALAEGADTPGLVESDAPVPVTPEAKPPAAHARPEPPMRPSPPMTGRRARAAPRTDLTAPASPRVLPEPAAPPAASSTPPPGATADATPPRESPAPRDLPGSGPLRIPPSSGRADVEGERARAAVRALILGSAGALPTSVEAQRALLPAATTCPRRVAGVWRAQRYAPLLGLWVRFTLHIEERRDGTLVGTIRSRIWSGTNADRRPPPCSPGQIDTEHEMPARGRIDGDRISFGSRTHRLVADHCPRPFGRITGYAPDNFSGTLDETRQEFQSVNDDGAYDVNTPYVFRRTACLSGEE